ncbi:MAG: hypothetical protein U0228_03700 [Myxococcaceae bacterium]
MLARLAVTTLILAGSDFQPREAKDWTGRYYGLQQVGSDPYGYESISFTLGKGRTTLGLIWTRSDQTGEKERRDLQLTDVKIDAKGLTAKVKGKRPATIPEEWKGQFVTKYPPNNAKGPVVEGLLLEGGWFVSLTD